MFSSFFSSSSGGAEPRPRGNHSIAELWGTANYAKFNEMARYVNLSPHLQREEKVLERAELFYRTGALGLKYTYKIPDIEARRFVLRDSGALDMYAFATTGYGTYIHGSEYFSNGLVYSNRQKYPLTPAIFLRFFDISVQLVSLTFFAEDFNRYSGIMSRINSVNVVLRKTYPQTDKSHIVIVARRLSPL